MTDKEFLNKLDEIDNEITSTPKAFDDMINNFKSEVNNEQ